MFRFAKPAFLCLALIAMGCGTKASNVSGKVTYKGQALTAGTVTLIPSDGVVRTGTIGTDGSYKIENVPAGAVKIGVTTPAARGNKPPPGGRGETPAPAAPAPAAGAVSVPENYRDAATSGLTGEVKAGEPLDIKID